MANADRYTYLMKTIYDYNKIILSVLEMKFSDGESVSILSQDNLDLKNGTYNNANEIGNAVYTYNHRLYNVIVTSAGFNEGYDSRLNTKNNSIFDSTTDSELVTNIKTYNTEFINYLHSVRWINDKASAESVNAKISMT